MTVSPTMAQEAMDTFLKSLITPVLLSTPVGTSQPDGSGSATKVGPAGSFRKFFRK